MTDSASKTHRPRRILGGSHSETTMHTGKPRKTATGVVPGSSRFDTRPDLNSPVGPVRHTKERVSPAFRSFHRAAASPPALDAR